MPVYAPCSKALHAMRHGRVLTAIFRRPIPCAAYTMANIVLMGLSGCATYSPEPLAKSAALMPRISELRHNVPVSGPDTPPIDIDVTKALSVDQVGLLAVLNDPDLAIEQGQIDQAYADLISARTLPNPSLTAGVASLISGPGSTPAYSASVMQDITSLITYKAKVAAARSSYDSVNAQLLWQEWQVAQQARLLTVQIYGGMQEIQIDTQEERILSDELKQIQEAAGGGNLDLTDEAPLQANLAAAQSSLASAKLDYLKNWQELDALLGLQPDVHFSINFPEIAPLPTDTASLLETLPNRRPDLVALRLGYESSEEKLRAAVLSQFPPLSFGASGGTDTSNILSIGPQLTVDLPIFDRNQGGIASAKATREILHAQYQAELDSTVGTVHALEAQLSALEGDLAYAESSADVAKTTLEKAASAYEDGSLDIRSFADYQTATLDRELDVTHLQTQLNSTRLALEIELGIGLPQMRMAPQSGAGGAQIQQVTHS